jgi:hypothetical protein
MPLGEMVGLGLIVEAMLDVPVTERVMEEVLDTEGVELAVLVSEGVILEVLDTEGVELGELVEEDVTDGVVVIEGNSE